MIVLGLDSAMNGCSVALYDTELNKTFFEKSIEVTRGQAECLMPMVEGAVKSSCTMGYDDIDLIGVTSGPGAFTGMRIGISTAKSLGLALDIPVVGVSTFQAVLDTYKSSIDEEIMYDQYVILLETKRDDFYFQSFDAKTLEPKSEPKTIIASEFIGDIGSHATLVIGDAHQRLIEECEWGECSMPHFHDIIIPFSSMVAYRAFMKYKNTESVNECAPLYIRAPDVSVSKKLQRVLL